MHAGLSSSLRLRDSFSELRRDAIGGYGLRISIFLMFVFFLLLGLFFWRLPPEIPLTYSRPWGVQQLVHPSFLFLIAMGLIIVFFLNGFLASIVISLDTLLARIVVWTGTLTIFLLDITVFRIFLLIT